MRVLWFSPTPAMYSKEIWGHNGGGWITSLQSILLEDATIDLAIAFDTNTKLPNKIYENVHYFPIVGKKHLLDKLGSNRLFEYQKNQALKAIEEFKPDIIQLFGSESWYGRLVSFTDIPMLIHMQGSLPSYYNARYPPGMSVWNKIISSKTTLKQKALSFRIDSTFRKKAILETGIIKSNNYFMGRTHWDKAIVEFYNSDAKYYTCQEALRTSFTESFIKWKFKKTEKIRLVSVISGPLYKGVDVILKTAKLLKDNANLDFEWHICGTSSLDLFESVYGIKALEVNVKTLGVVSQDVLLRELLTANFYVHPSYIDNSPNSVCEAQLLGVPIISTDVGGIASLIEDGKTGFLVPSNDPLMIASTIKKYYDKRELLESLSYNSISIAECRHSRESIRKTLLAVYKDILEVC